MDTGVLGVYEVPDGPPGTVLMHGGRTDKHHLFAGEMGWANVLDSVHFERLVIAL